MSQSCWKTCNLVWPSAIHAMMPCWHRQAMLLAMLKSYVHQEDRRCPLPYQFPLNSQKSLAFGGNLTARCHCQSRCHHSRRGTQGQTQPTTRNRSCKLRLQKSNQLRNSFQRHRYGRLPPSRALCAQLPDKMAPNHRIPELHLQKTGGSKRPLAFLNQ